MSEVEELWKKRARRAFLELFQINSKVSLTCLSEYWGNHETAGICCAMAYIEEEEATNKCLIDCLFSVSIAETWDESLTYNTPQVVHVTYLTRESCHQL